MTIAEVKLWGKPIGAVSWDESIGIANFEYEPDFIRSGIEVAPLMMPLNHRIYSFPALSRETYFGLPGLLSDSLPDDFGHALIDAWLAKEGRNPDSFNPVERLCYTGTRGMGALEYAPIQGPSSVKASEVNIEALVKLASEILNNRNQLAGSLKHRDRGDTLSDILQVGTSAGGARAKAIIAWNPASNEVRSGQVNAGDGFSYWLLKFDGVSGNPAYQPDNALADPAGYGLVEYAYYNMAKQAGIEMAECRLLKEHNRAHFMTRRFDRTKRGRKVHMQTLCAMEHFDYKKAGAYSYEQALLTVRKLKMSMDSVEEQFRRMAFNILARNQDDHVKNIAFLMDQAGNWFLSPAYDMTYSYNPGGVWTDQHQMSLNGKRDEFTLVDFQACARNASMKRGRAEEILQQVQGAVVNWRTFADEAGVPDRMANRIAMAHRLDILD